MKPDEKIATVAEALVKDGWAIYDGAPTNPHTVTACHFDAWPMPISVHVTSDLQGRLSLSITNTGGALTFNDRLLRIVVLVAGLRG